MKIQESGEMYLETILILQKRNGYVRSIDIANELQYTKPSISVAMRRLRGNGYIEVDGNGHITLTEQGFAIADSLYHRHLTLTSLLIHLGVEPTVAEQDACRIEHIISEQTFQKLHQYEEKLSAEEDTQPCGAAE